MTKLIVVDGNAALWRFGFVNIRLTDSDGRQTGGVYGFLRGLLRLKHRYPDAVFAIAWDGGGRTWRHEFFDGYKAKRNKPAKEDEVKVDIGGQIQLLNPILRTLGIPYMRVPQIEADDMASLLAARAQRCGLEPIIYSGDRDYFQLLRFGVGIIRDTAQNKDRLKIETTTKGVFECEPHQVLMFRAMVGDASDGINGVMGVGPVTAAKLLKAGLSEANYFKATSDAARSKVFKQREIVARNLTLMRLPRTVEKLPNAAQAAAYAEIVKASMSGGAHSNVGERLIKQLGGLLMTELLAERAALMRLQVL
jgi:DNA polymerase-1